jgi:hypothetical protein
MDFVFINPSEIATRFFQVFERSLTIGVKLTDEFVPQYEPAEVGELPLLDFGFQGSFDTIAWDKPGVALQKMHKFKQFDLDEYQDNEVPDDVILIDMICHQRVYAVTSQWLRKDGGWVMQRNADINNDKHGYKALAIEEIEKRRLYGTIQTYIYPDKSVKFKLHPIDMAYITSKEIVNRHWITIYPSLVANRNRPEVTNYLFNAWIDKTSI